MGRGRLGLLSEAGPRGKACGAEGEGVQTHAGSANSEEEMPDLCELQAGLEPARVRELLQAMVAVG